MIMPYSTLRGLEGDVEQAAGSTCFSRKQSPSLAKARHKLEEDKSVVIVEFRDEIYAPVAKLLRQFGFATDRAISAIDLGRTLVSNSPDLILLSATQPDESAWLTCAKLRIIDASLPVLMYSPSPPGAFDQWVSMAGINSVVVYGGVLFTLLQHLEQRITSVDPYPKYTAHDSEERGRISSA